MLLTRFGGQSPKRCESYLGASGKVTNEKGSQIPLMSAIVKVRSPPTLALGELEMITVEEREAIRRAYYRARADELLAENAHLPPKQQYTGHKIYELLQAEGYQGSEARVRLHLTQWNKAHTA